MLALVKSQAVSHAPFKAGKDMHHLIQRLCFNGKQPAPQIVAFIAARRGEGTSTIARDYALSLAVELSYKVLLIDAGLSDAQDLESAGLIDALLIGHDLQTAILPLNESVSIARWIGDETIRAQAGRLLRDPDLWQTLRSLFDTVIIDAPALQGSFDGIVLAAMADATILVVEAETTRQPVVENLRDTLEGSGATIAGLVMNKRRFYIPHGIYRRL